MRFQKWLSRLGLGGVSNKAPDTSTNAENPTANISEKPKEQMQPLLKRSRKIEIIGVQHSIVPRKVDQTGRVISKEDTRNFGVLKEYLDRKLKLGQTVALEVTPNILSDIINKRVPRFISGNVFDVEGLLFIKRLIEYLNSRKINIISLKTAEERSPIIKSSQILRDQRYARKIAKLATSGKKPDLVIVGAAHIETLASLLEKRGFVVKRTYKTRHSDDEVRKIAEKWMGAREKERLALLKRKLQKKQRQRKSGKLRPKRRPLPR